MIIHDNTNWIWWSSIIFALIGIGWFHWFCFLWDDVSWVTMFGIGSKQTHFLGAYHLLHSQSWIMNPKLPGVLLSEICEILGWLSVFPADLRCRCWRRLRWECTISAKMPVLPTWWSLEEISWLLQQSSRFQRWGCRWHPGDSKSAFARKPSKTHRTKTV